MGSLGRVQGGQGYSDPGKWWWRGGILGQRFNSYDRTKGAQMPKTWDCPLDVACFLHPAEEKVVKSTRAAGRDPLHFPFKNKDQG